MENTQVEQIYTSCLAQGSYFIESAGEAIVIDPLRESSPYLRRAEERGVKIKYIFETHFHADFVSGHLDLAKKTGAQIVYGPNAKTSFEKIEAEDGAYFSFGNLKIKALHTPGHTPESTCYLLFDETGAPHSIYTGDTLFIGDVGRPDLAQKATHLTKEDLAGWLYDSLRSKIMPLPDHVIVYPAHGAGSACGKNMSSETWDTLGNQKLTNYALDRNMTRESFIKELTEGLLPPPQYFAKNAALNKKGYASIDEVIRRGLTPHSIDETAKLMDDTSVLFLDVRDKWEFASGHIPGSIFIGLDGSFAPWVGALIQDLQQKIFIIAPKDKEEEAVRRLARVGYDHTIGYIDGSFEAWKNAGKEMAKLETVSIEEYLKQAAEGQIGSIIDVRKPTEYKNSHLVGSTNLALDFISDWQDNFDDQKTNYLHCRSGYRSTVASSILQSIGKSNLINVVGMFDEFEKNGADVLHCESSC